MLLPGDQYRLLVEHAPTLVWRSGLDAKCDYFNKTWLDFTGRTLEEEMGDGWTTGIHPDDFDRCVAHYLENFEKRRPFEMEYRLRRSDGAYRWIFDRGVPFADDGGAFAGFIGSCVDVHDRRVAEEQKATFLSLMAHELRTPLTSLRTFLEGMRRRLDAGTPVAPSVVGRAIAQVDRFEVLVRDLGEAARLENAGALALETRTVDLRGVVESVVGFFEAAEEIGGGDRRHPVELVLPAAAVRVEADEQRIAQALENLLDNARKYTPGGGRIAVRLTVEGGWCMLSVEDRGIGIPEADLPRVGSRYFRAANASPRNYPGLGLGLALAAEIVERHRGALEVRSTVGKGSLVTLRLPLAGQRS